MSGNPPAAAEAPADWRKSVLQSYRNSEVREISKVLAALEGSATPASKLMLAMRFEDQIFKSAKDLADYRKKISKRLKKLKKNYVAPAAAAPQGASGAPGAATAQGGSGGDNTEAKAELAAKLKRDYGDQLKYIVTNARSAVEDLKKKLGPDKAMQLQQHTDSCRLWARDLGILTEEELDAIGPSAGAAQQEKTEAKANGDSTPKSEDASNKAAPMSFAQLQRIEKHLQTRVSNIRSYVVKHADPDQFLLETLQSKDVLFAKNVVGGNLFRDSLKGQLSTRREMYEKATERDNNNNNKPGDAHKPQTENIEDPLLELQKALEKAQAGVPPPTRNNNMKLEGSLRHLDKMRASSIAMMSYWMLDGDKRVATAPRDTLKKVHEVVQEGVDFVLDAVKELEQQKKIRRYNGVTDTADATSDAVKASTVSLQDAWSKTIELPSAAPINVDEDDNSNKRQRTNSYRPYYKSRMLFRPNRKTPQPLLAAIRRKGAKLKKTDCGNTNAVHLVLDFESAFSMTIYLSPLTVTLRAKPQGSDDSSSSSSSMGGSSAHWNALSHGLTPWGSTLDSSDFLRRKAQQNNNNNNNINNNTGDNNNPGPELSVWGVTSNYESIGRVVEERLRDASTHATAILRKCFKNHVKDKTMDFEVELLEGSALLEFLQLARSTYMPHWEDEDV